MALSWRIQKTSRLAAALFSTCLFVSGPAEADEAATLEDARWAFVEGTSHYEARRFDQALVSFQRSYGLVQSPNALLMLARCERELGRRADAAVTFDRALQEAKKRVAAGETKYAPTAQAAIDEGQKLRASLGTLRIHVEDKGASLKADGKPIAISPEGEATVLREPGMATVELIAASGARQRQTVTVTAGATVSMAFGSHSGTPPSIDTTAPNGSGSAAAPSSTTSNRAWATPAAMVSGGIMVVGGAAFAGFGLSSQSIYDRLEARCGPNRCGPADQDEADRGARNQMLANVSLGVAVTAAVATVVFVVLALEGSPSTRSRNDRQRAAPSILW